MNRKKKIAISTALLLLMQLLVGLATQNPANASVISGDSHEWGLPLVPGVGSTYYTPQALQSDTFISQMSIGGGGSALALQNDGTAISWGNDDQGQLGDGSSGYHTASAPMLLPPVVQVSSGGNSWGVGLTGSGEVYSWGRNSENELGRAGGSAPDKVPGLPFIKQIAAGNMHAIALDSSGNVWAWGYNSRGQLGDANRSGTSYQTPSEVQNLPVVITKIFTKFDTNFALDASGNVYAWGENGSGQFGSPTSDGLHHGINYDPFKIAGIPAMSQIAPGMYSVTALDTSGNVWTWGNNTNGYLGDGSAKTSWHSPVQIGISNAIWVATGQTDSFAVLASGALKGWGWNFAGELGIGNTTEQDTPVTVSGISSASGVDISSTHAVVWNAISSNTAVISSVSASVTPNSALYEMKATANFSGVACPARLIAIVGGTTRTSSSLCSTGGTAPTSKDWNFSVTALSPNSSVPISLLIDDDNGAKTYASSVTTPKPPVWIATGDSFSSGHHQDTDEPCAVNTYVAAQVANSLFGTYAGTCLDKDGSGATSLTKNDAAYSWATRARNSLMTALGIPTVWKMTIDVVADSGAPASGFANAGGQQANMISDLTARAGSWNIVTTSGGADDVNFGAALQSFYENASTWNTKPWQVTSRSSCPDTDAIYSRVGSTGSSTNTALANLFLAASNADANVRKLAITYPYVLESTNTCEGYDSGTAPHNGAKQVIDALDANISSLSSIGVHVVDLRSVTGFGSSPMSDIQQTRYFGYPHPSSAGQNDIASAVNSALS